MMRYTVPPLSSWGGDDRYRVKSPRCVGRLPSCAATRTGFSRIPGERLTWHQTMIALATTLHSGSLVMLTAVPGTPSEPSTS